MGNYTKVISVPHALCDMQELTISLYPYIPIILSFIPSPISYNLAPLPISRNIIISEAPTIPSEPIPDTATPAAQIAAGKGLFSVSTNHPPSAAFPHGHSKRPYQPLDLLKGKFIPTGDVGGDNTPTAGDFTLMDVDESAEATQTQSEPRKEKKEKSKRKKDPKEEAEPEAAATVEVSSEPKKKRKEKADVEGEEKKKKPKRPKVA